MRLLALDTATEACSAAVFIDNEVSSRFEIAPRRHAELILPMIDEVMTQADVTLAQLDAVAVGGGPGSFTGVRIAMGVAQGIAFAADLPVIPISTLAALALEALRQSDNPPNNNIRNVAVALDARMHEVYWGLYQVDSSSAAVQALIPDCVSPPQQVPVAESNDSRVFAGAGSGWLNYSETLSQRLKVVSYQPDCYPSAAAIAQLAAIAWQQDKTKAIPAELAQPVYLRDKVTHR